MTPYEKRYTQKIAQYLKIIQEKSMKINSPDPQSTFVSLQNKKQELTKKLSKNTLTCIQQT